MRSYRPVLITACVGLLTFGVVFAYLQLSRSGQSADQVLVEPTPVSVPVVPGDSLAAGMAAGSVAVGLPIRGSDQLLQAARAGDRLDVLASLPSPADGRPFTGVAVSNALVLRTATLTDPLLLQVSGPDAIVLAHLVLGGTHLTYTVRPEGADPASQPPMDERTARALLDLPALATAAPPPRELGSTPTSVPAPRAVPTEAARPATYTSQAGESLYSVAARLGVDPGALWWANRSLVDPTAPLVAGSTLLVPVHSGFLYQVQPGDTWEDVSATFSVPVAELRRANELPEDVALVSGMLLFIARDS